MFIFGGAYCNITRPVYTRQDYNLPSPMLASYLAQMRLILGYDVGYNFDQKTLIVEKLGVIQLQLP